MRPTTAVPPSYLARPRCCCCCCLLLALTSFPIRFVLQTSQAAPAAEIVLPPHTKHTAAVLCHAIRMELQKGDVPTAMTPSGKRSVPWDRVARNPMLLNTTVYGVPTKCQRLWKFIAYGFDIGDSTCLAPDSDDEDLPSNGAADGAAAGAVGGAAAAGAGAGAGAGEAAGL